MDIFKRIATILGVAVIGYFGFYFVCVFYNMIAFLFGGKDSQNTMAILTAIVASVYKGILHKTTKYGLPTY